MTNISEFLSEIFQFLEVKFSVYLNRRVLVMMTVKRCSANHADGIKITSVRNILFRPLKERFNICPAE